MFAKLSRDWSHLNVTVSRIKPPPSRYNGLMITVDQSDKHRFSEIPFQSFRKLATQHGTVLLRGFEPELDEEVLKKNASQIGVIVPHAAGVVFNICNVGDEFISRSEEPLPIHYDHAFREPDDFRQINFNLLHCLEQSGGTALGATKWVDTRTVYDELSPDEQARLSKLSIRLSTGESAREGFYPIWEDKMVREHPETGEKVIRYHELWKGSDLREIDVEVFDGYDSEQDKIEVTEWIHTRLRDLITDENFCYAHGWKRGDYLLNDDRCMLHWRTDLVQAGRWLRRCHLS